MDIVRTSEEREPLNPLERTAIARIIARQGDAKAALQAQLEQAESVHRTHSGVGFMTRIAVAEAAPAAPAGVMLRPVYASHPQLPEPAEFMLQVKDGRLKSLEAYCFNGMWPQDESRFTFDD